MADNSSLEDLLDLWELRRNQGEALAPEEFLEQVGSQLTPEQVVELRRAIQDLADMDRALNSGGEEPAPGGEGTDTISSRNGQTVMAQTRFRVTRLHARGGLGEVYVATDEECGRDVALKVIQTPRARMAASRGRFRRESQVTGRLEHPGIVPVYASGEDGAGVPFYVMRLVTGRTLQDAVLAHHGQAKSTPDPSGRRLAFQQLLRRFVAVCDTVAYAHSKGVLHRDLKPSNILVGEFGETLVVDWGLARVFSGGNDQDLAANSPIPDEAQTAPVTQEGAVLGTPAYMSPEQASGQVEELGPASDVYGLGAVLYTILTGRPAFEGGNIGAILQGVREGKFASPRTIRPEIPKSLEAVCLKAMATRPGERYPSAAELGRDVERWLADEPVIARREPWTVRARRWLVRHRTLASSAAAAVLVALVSLIIATVFLNVAWADSDKQRKVAVKQLQHANRAVGEFFTTFNDDPQFLGDDPRFREMRKKLLERARAFHEEFLEDAADHPTLRWEVARAYFRLGNLKAELKSGLDALADYQMAHDLFDRLAHTDPHPDLLLDIASVCSVMVDLKVATGRIAEARTDLKKALRLCQRLVQKDSDSKPYRLLLAQTLGSAARLEINQRNLEAARSLDVDARWHLESLHQEEPASYEYTHELAAVYKDLVP